MAGKSLRPLVCASVRLDPQSAVVCGFVFKSSSESATWAQESKEMEMEASSSRAETLASPANLEVGHKSGSDGQCGEE